MNTTAEELSINHLNISTNNAAESYHSKLRSILKTHRPRIWTFMTAVNNIMEAVDNDMGRLCLGKEICRSKQKVYVKIEEQRRTC